MRRLHAISVNLVALKMATYPKGELESSVVLSPLVKGKLLGIKKVISESVFTREMKILKKVDEELINAFRFLSKAIVAGEPKKEEAVKIRMLEASQKVNEAIGYLEDMDPMFYEALTINELCGELYVIKVEIEGFLSEGDQGNPVIRLIKGLFRG